MRYAIGIVSWAMTKMIQSIPDIVDQIGVTALARALGKHVTTVSSWKARRSIPVEHWPRLLEISHEAQQELTLEALVSAHTKGRAA